MGLTAPEGCLERPNGWNGRPLDSARLILRAPEPKDAPRIVTLLADPEVARHTAQIPHPYSFADAERFILASAVERNEGKGMTLAIVERTTGELVGCIGAPFAPGTAEIGYWLGRPYWGRGYVTEAARRVLRCLFQDCGRGLVWSGAVSENPASLRVQEKIGMVFDRREKRSFPARGTQPEVNITVIDREGWELAHAARPRGLVAAVALIDSDGRVLLAQRPPGKSMAGLWEFPGGKLNDGETPEAALVRELDEELGIDIAESCLAPIAFASHDYDTFHLMMPLYACRQWRGQVEPREGQKLDWVRPTRLTDYPMPPADVPLVAALRDLL